MDFERETDFFLFFLPFFTGNDFFFTDFDLDFLNTFFDCTKLANDGLAIFFIFFSRSLGVVRYESIAKDVLESEGFTVE